MSVLHRVLQTHTPVDDLWALCRKKCHRHVLYLHWSQLVGYQFKQYNAGNQHKLANSTTICQTYAVLFGITTLRRNL